MSEQVGGASSSAPAPIDPEENARAYIEKEIMPYLTPGIEELLKVAKERGEVQMEGDELELGTVKEKKDAERKRKAVRSHFTVQ